MSEEDEEKEAAQAKLAEEVGSTLRGLYKDYRGRLFVVFSESVCEATGELLVHYYSLERRTRWTRTVGSFTERVLVDKLQVGPSVPRFAFVRDALDDELHLAAFDND